MFLNILKISQFIPILREDIHLPHTPPFLSQDKEFYKIYVDLRKNFVFVRMSFKI